MEKPIMIRACLVMLAALVLSAPACNAPAAADTRAVYTIKDIPVDESAETVIEAQERAFAAARVIGARRLIQKITLPDDRAKAGGVPIDDAIADRLVAAVDVQEETRGGGRYKGVLSTVLNPRMVRAHLKSLDVPYVDRQGPLALLVPVASLENEAAWANAWPDAVDGALAPLVTARLGGYGPDADWLAIQPEADATSAQRGVVAALSGAEGAYSVRLSQVTPSGSAPLGVTRAAATMEEAAAAASAYLDAVWKNQSVVRSGERTVVDANVRYTSLAEWNTLRSALSRSPLVSDFKVSAVARDGALISFAFAGDQNRLSADLRQRGVALEAGGGVWVMRSAVAGGAVR